MTQISSRPPFFPNSSSSQSSRAKNVSYSSDIANNKINSPERVEEINTLTGEHARVDIPESIKDFSSIKRAVDNAPQVDNSEKIAALKQKIQNGTYEIDYDGLADKIIDSEY